MKRARAARVMAMATRVAGDKEGNGDSNKRNDDGGNVKDDKDSGDNNTFQRQW